MGSGSGGSGGSRESTPLQQEVGSSALKFTIKASI
jgi:hypothetical protein